MTRSRKEKYKVDRCNRFDSSTSDSSSSSRSCSPVCRPKCRPLCESPCGPRYETFCEPECRPKRKCKSPCRPKRKCKSKCRRSCSPKRKCKSPCRRRDREGERWWDRPCNRCNWRRRECRCRQESFQAISTCGNYLCCADRRRQFLSAPVNLTFAQSSLDLMIQRQTLGPTNPLNMGWVL